MSSPGSSIWRGYWRVSLGGTAGGQGGLSTHAAIAGELGALFGEPGALRQEGLMRRQDVLGITASDEKGDDGARKILKVADAGLGGVFGAALGKGKLGAVGGGIPIASALGHFHVRACGRRGDLLVEAVGHCDGWLEREW
jgi:hypothetical protein